MKKYVIPVIFSLICGALLVPDFSYAQSCFDGSSWEGPGANPPLANRTKPIYSSCGDPQDITSDLNFTGMIDVIGTSDFDEVLSISHVGTPTNASFSVLHDATSAAAAEILLSGGVGGLYLQRSAETTMGFSNSGVSLRVQDVTNNPEIQLQYGTGNNDEHWSIYANGLSDDSLRFWSYNGGTSADRMMITQNGEVGIGGEPTAGLHVRNETYDSSPDVYGTQIGSGNIELARQSPSDPYIDFLNEAGSGLDYDARIMLRDDDLLTVEGANLHVRYSSQQSSHALAVNGTSYFGNSISIVDGTEAAGYVLSSDASGNASWSPVSSVQSSDLYWKLSGSDLYASTTSWDVGVGTNDPAEDFHIADILGPRLMLSREASATPGDWLGQIMFESSDGGYSTDDTAPVVIRAISSEDHGTSDKGGELIIMTKQDGDSTSEAAKERMRFENDGDITVGTDSNVPKFIVSSANTTTGGFYVSRYAADDQGLRVYATDRDLYMIYNEDTGESYPGTWHFLNQEADGGLSREFMTAYYNTTDSDTYVGIHDTTPDYPLDVGGDVGAVTYYATSDKRLKDDIYELDSELDTIMKLRPVTFTWKEDVQNMPVHGLIAQDVELLYPYIVSTNGEGYKSVSYDQFIPILIKGMQEQQEYIDELEARLDRLEQAVYVK